VGCGNRLQPGNLSKIDLLTSGLSVGEGREGISESRFGCPVVADVGLIRGDGVYVAQVFACDGKSRDVRKSVTALDGILCDEVAITRVWWRNEMSVPSRGRK